MADKQRPFANTSNFYTALGWYHAVWSATELNIDYVIGKLKKLPPEATHALVAALKFSDKTKLLRSLLNEAAPANIAQLRDFLDRIDNDFRNVFSHSFLASDAKTITFIHRTSRRGKYSCTCYQFEAENFLTHVRWFVQLADDFEKTLGLDHKQVADFAAYAVPEIAK